jgi:L-xylulokinase
MAGPYLLGIDNGSTVIKAALFDLTGRSIAVQSRPLELLQPAPGHTEFDLDELWRQTAGAIRDVVAESGVDSSAIAGIGATGHGNGLMLLDRKGEALGHGIASLDARASGIVEGWQRDGTQERVHPIICQNIWAAQPAALLAWIKANDRARYEAIGTICLVKDFVRLKLTGRRGSDFTDMSGTSLLNVRTREYSPKLLEALGLAECMGSLPPLTDSAQVFGSVTADAAGETGLRVDTPVVAGLYDIDASALGSGVIDPGDVCVIAGTWSINEVISAQPVPNRDILMMKGYVVPGRWSSIEASATSAVNLEWFVRTCCERETEIAAGRSVSVFEVCSELAAKVPLETATVIFHPFLHGANGNPAARAGFYGLAGWHGKPHMLRAILEGVAFSHRQHVDTLRATGLPMRDVKLTGGGARSAVWSQMFADVLGLPVSITDEAEVGARGAAMCAGIGVALFASHADAVARMVRVSRRYEPSGAAAVHYDRRYTEYLAIAEAMRQPWVRLSAAEHA